MFAVVIRISLIAVILFNALVPSPASASSLRDNKTTSPKTNTNNDLASGITLGAPNSHVDEQVPILSEQIAKQAQQTQEEKPLRFKISAEPAI